MKKILFFLCLILPYQLQAQVQHSLLRHSAEDLIRLAVQEKEQETVSTASKKAEKILAAPAVMSVITAQEIEAFGANHLGEVLERVTSIYNVGQTFVPNNIMAVRGKANVSYNTQVLVLLNGRPMRESWTNGNVEMIYQYFPLNSIERIEVIRGSGSALYGSNAYLAVFNIITKRLQQNTQIQAALRYGSFDTWQVPVSLSKKIGELEIQAHAFYHQTAGWDFTARGETDMRIVNGQPTIVNPPKTIPMEAQAKSLFFKANYKGLQLQAFGVDSKYNIMNLVPAWLNPITTFQDRRTLFADLSYQKKLNEKWEINTKLNANYLEGGQA